MEDQNKYKLLQYSTVGWEEIYTKLTKEECTKVIESLLSEGVNPQYMKVLLDND